MAFPVSLDRTISPPPISKKRTRDEDNKSLDGKEVRNAPNLAAIEAGKSKIRNHLEHFSYHLGSVARPRPAKSSKEPQLSVPEFATLYQQNQHPNGHHFVIHQHNHPVAGVHYDLRLQFSETSTLSFAIPYGVPGNPNSRRQGRLAIETRVHNLWNNLIESASHSTGSLLIWDTGEYEVLPRITRKNVETDDEKTDGSENEDMSRKEIHENKKLIHGFQTKYIRLRLHGTRLPENYTITIRLPSNPYTQPKGPPRKRRSRKAPSTVPSTPASSDTEDAVEVENLSAIGLASDSEEEPSSIRNTNAYPGATNSISSIHQRHWFVSLDKANSGLIKAKNGPDEGKWVCAPGRNFKSFFVRGAQVERSIITGRTSEEVMIDEGVEGFVGRKMWKAVLD